ncbi:MAG: 50S ribosomal protein L14 [Chlamydiota bacterium]
MIHEETELLVADNTGVKKVKCFRVLGGSRKRYAAVGDVIVASVQEVTPSSSIKKGDVVKAVVVRTQAPISRQKDGQILTFYDNSCVIIDEKKNPKGTRIFGSVAREVRDKGFIKITSLAPEVI